ncbi:MAG TPA: CpsD/CapB family tyrosine-protein kinase [Candidatus Acidoferrum sp.]|nr:CpsD/CapB family tyrosine-protein kinase [Candidatus Acidoferrum sp.]
MSRIHEALKIAAQERSMQLAAGLEACVAEVTGEIRRPITGEPDVARPAGPPQVIADSNQGVPLRYEELVKRCAHPEWRLDPLNSVFQNSKTGQGGSERFRTLRSRLYQIAGTRRLRRLLVTSGVAGEGKTFVASNLAQSIVQQPELRVLLLDADLRASRLHMTLGAPSRPGLTDYLRGEADEYAVIQKGMEENLCLIPGGSQASNPSELLLSERMKHLLNLLTPIFDWIIIDTPPTLPVHDASVLADLVDGVLLVLRAGSTDVDVAERTVAEFRGKNLLGVVLNQVEKNDSYGDRYYYTEGV